MSVPTDPAGGPAVGPGINVSFSWPDGVWLKNVSLHSSHFHSPPRLQLPRPSTDCQTLGLFSGKGFHNETLPHTRDQFVFTRLTFWMLLRATLRRWLFDELRPVMLTLWSTVRRLRSAGWRRLLNVRPGRSPGLWCTWSGLRTGHSRDLHSTGLQFHNGRQRHDHGDCRTATRQRNAGHGLCSTAVQPDSLRPADLW